MEKLRYKQRFENFQKSYLLLESSLAIEKPSIIEKGGCIQFFEITFELSWKLMKDFLEYNGYQIRSPRDAIKQAFSFGLINHGDVWIDALMDRNLTVHTYEESVANDVFQKIKTIYFPLLKDLYTYFRE
ncbi:MAG: nucleotidyltransferase substrate binding protein [Candidatus Marinimicrobia bacterium]|nr:nucleotidyltransferase substrate binding protein [Candidatus Neomarinimicrobiota bacterium]